MIRFFTRRFGDRRAATAMVLAILFVPLVISAGAAVDFARIASARALMQAAVDSAAVEGVGAWQMSASNTNASSVANAVFSGTAAQLANFVTLSSARPLVQLTCTGSAAQCGVPASNYAATATSYGCPAASKYCVVVSSSATLKNSLLAFVIPSDVLTVTSVATSAFPPNVINQGSFTHTSVGYGSDLSGIYAYVVPEDGNGNPQIGTVPAPNTNCETAGESASGPIADEPASAFVAPTTAAGTNCNFLLIGENSSGTGKGTLSFAANDPVAFTFVNFSGGTVTSGNGALDETNYSTSGVTIGTAATQFKNELYVTVSGSNVPNSMSGCTAMTNGSAYCPSGYTVPAVAAVTYVAPSGNNRGTTGNAAVAAMVLYGNCPAHNLYGSINAYPNTANNLVPTQDSINTYSSAYEYLGWPPTHGTNHQLVPFLGPANVQSVNETVYTPPNKTQSTATTSYTVQPVCPQWPTTGTNIAASGTITPGGSLPAETVPIYATYYPDQTYSDGTANVYPPAITACTPVTSGSVPAPGTTNVYATPSATAKNPWWGWSPSNANAYDPSDTAAHNCTFAHVGTTGKLVTNTVGTPVPTGDSTSNWSTAPFTATSYSPTNTAANSVTSYDNCALLIQDIGQNATALPTYYTYLADPTAFTANLLGYPTGSTGNPAGITDLVPQTGTPPKTFPNGVSISGVGPYSVSEPNLDGDTYYPPEDTSHQCYNPQANGIDSATLTGLANNDTHPATPNDPVENPGDGVVFCGGTTANESYALYWNDMGSYPEDYNDDLGYANAVTEFTCPTQASATGGGPSTLSD